MRSVKGIIIGFLLILLGFAAAQYSLIAAGILSAGGLAAVVVSALPKRAEKQEPQAAPAAPVPAPAELSAPELLPDILTDPPVQPKMPPLPQPEAEALYKTLADAYTRIDALSCRGPAWMLERDIRLCKAFCARWDSAKADAQTAAILREKARFVEYSNEFLLPGFGRHGRIPSRRTSGDLLEDLSAAVLKQAAQQQAALEAALRGQKWFEGVKSSSGPFSRDWPTRLRRKRGRTTRRPTLRRSRGRPRRNLWKHFTFSRSKQRAKAPRAAKLRSFRS